MKPKVIVILGQTATGKSELAVKIAEKFGGEIISADSRQVYKNLDIGTGKISKREMRGIAHHLIDVVDPKKRFTVAEFQKIANKTIKSMLRRKKIPIICGGTGFYIDSITRGLVLPKVKPNIKLRKDLDKKTNIELFGILQELDAMRAKDIKDKNEINNKVRLIRAIEIARTLGSVPKDIENAPSYEFIKIGLVLPKEALEAKIRKRVKKMFDSGLLREIQKLRRMGVSEKRLSEFGFEYNKPTLEGVILATIQYAKRQMTWFYKDKEIKWFAPQSKKEIYGFIRKQLY